MASASSDDDGRSFGSEPDFAAMSDLRLVEDDPGPSGTHVFDEIHDDAPRDFGHELEVVDGERLRAALEAFEDAVYADGAGGAPDADDLGSEPNEAVGGAWTAPAAAPAKPRRVHADRQTTRPVLEQAREWRRLAPHLRVRGASVASAPRGAGDVEGVQMVAMPTAPTDPQREVPGSSADDDAAPWRSDSASEWWGECAALRVRGRRAPKAFFSVPSGSSPAGAEPLVGAEEEVFAEDGELVETFADDTPSRGDGSGDAGAPFGSQSDFLASERAARRRAAGLPCVDPPVVLALDRAFLRGEIGAGEVEVPTPGDAGVLAWRAGSDGDGDGDGGDDGDVDSAFGDDEWLGRSSGVAFSATFSAETDAALAAAAADAAGFAGDARWRSPPDSRPGEVRRGAPGACSESEWSDADSEERRRRAPEPRAPRGARARAARRCAGREETEPRSTRRERRTPSERHATRYTAYG